MEQRAIVQSDFSPDILKEQHGITAVVLLLRKKCYNWFPALHSLASVLSPLEGNLTQAIHL